MRKAVALVARGVGSRPQPHPDDVCAEQHLLSVIQDDFPLEECPYQVLAGQLGSDEQSVFDAVENLRMSGVIRRIGGVYDSKALGFISRLCAGKVPTVATGAADDLALDKFAAAVNEIPAITHNYVRSHEYNVWFTIIAQSEDEIRTELFLRAFF